MFEGCQSCGCCCFSSSSAYVPVGPRDLERFREEDAPLLHQEDGAWFMAMEDDHCAALHRRGGRFECSIYARRPSACRELELGSPACAEEIREKRRLVALSRR